MLCFSLSAVFMMTAMFLVCVEQESENSGLDLHLPRYRTSSKNKTDSLRIDEKSFDEAEVFQRDTEGRIYG